jgi:hypothetical protein
MMKGRLKKSKSSNNFTHDATVVITQYYYLLSVAAPFIRVLLFFAPFYLLPITFPLVLSSSVPPNEFFSTDPLEKALRCLRVLNHMIFRFDS